MSKYEFAFDVSTLSDYTNENTGLIGKAVYGSRTIADGIEVIVGQKGNIKLNTLTNDLYLQAAACGWTVSGGTNLAQVSITVCPLDYKEALCPKDLERKWYGQLMAAGSDPETFPFAEYIIGEKIKKLSSEIEKLFWQGNTSTGTVNMVLCDGFIKFLSGTTTNYVATASGATITAANVIGLVNETITNIPEQIALQEDLTLYMSTANYKTYTAALRTANMFHFNGEDGKDMATDVPGTNVRAVATPGLTGLNTWYLEPKSNMVFVTDLLDETEDLDMWYSQDNREVRVTGSLKFGVGCYFTDFVTHNNPNL